MRGLGYVQLWVIILLSPCWVLGYVWRVASTWFLVGVDDAKVRK